MLQSDSVVDLSFPVQGGPIPADHGYPLYGAVSRHLPTIHADSALGIHPIRGQLVGQRLLALTRESRLVFRLPPAKVPEVVRIAGQTLDVAGIRLLVGVPTTHPLRPAATLVSRLVVIRGFTEADEFLAAVCRQMTEQGVTGSAALIARQGAASLEAQRGSREQVVRRTLRIRDKEVVGFAVRVGSLSPADSLRLQAGGIGGRRRFGCGIFLPVSE